MPVLTHTYAGPAYPVHLEGDAWRCDEQPERIAGAFRRVTSICHHDLIGNGEEPEKFWRVEWEDQMAYIDATVAARIEDKRVNPHRYAGEVKAFHTEDRERMENIRREP